MTQQDEPIRVAVVDDHAMMRTGIIQTLQEQGGFAIVSEGASADDACRIAACDNAEIILIDINMPGGGLQALREIVGQSLPVKIVMLTVCDSLSNVQQAMQSGAAGFVPKGIDGDDLARILRDVHSGRKHVNPDLAARLFEESTFGAEDGAPELPSIQLTEREAQIHALIGKGMSNAEIASKLGLKETTVKQYSSYLFQKLGVKNRTAAALRLK